MGGIQFCQIGSSSEFGSIFLPGFDVQRVLNDDTTVWPMFVERKACYSALFTNLVGWHASAFSYPLSDVIFVQIACPLSDVMFCLHSGITNLSLYKHCVWLDGAAPLSFIIPALA